jgi:mannose-1-phosphate guanylyltransferase/mannose-6-phosphate isomerase
MFMFRADSYLMELEKYAPELLEHAQKIFDTAMHDADFTRFDSDTFMQCPSISIDYALMEKSENAAVIPLDLSWSDIGSWDALHEASSQDEHGNVLLGDVYAIGVNNSYIHANNRMIAALGLNDHIIVETNDAVLVAHKDYCQHIKPLVEQLKKEGRSEALVHPYEYRPWGKYEIISESPTFKVKFITVSPKKRLSLQKHEHRSEHWVVVKGTAHVTRDEEIIVLKENQSTYIPSGTKHRLENLQENEMLYIIEVQCGEYLGEDDIIRYNDDYGR